MAGSAQLRVGRVLQDDGNLMVHASDLCYSPANHHTIRYTQWDFPTPCRQQRAFPRSLEPILADATKRVKFLKTVGELLDWTLQEIIPPFAASRHDHRGNTPFEWVFGFAAWCGRVCAYLTHNLRPMGR
jgi:hypothetical protein